jgi:tetratricopeptide (TPR) repeat protein
VLILAATLGLYFASQPPAGERETSEPSAGPQQAMSPDLPATNRASEAGEQDRLPLDPLVPQSGPSLIAEAERVAGDLARRFPQNPDAQEMLARFQFEFADINAAEAAWKRCLELSSGYVHAYAGLAKVAAQRGEFGAAVAHWRRAILAEPQRLSHQIELGKALLAAGEIEEAVAVLAAVVRSSPANAEGHAELGAAQLQKRDDAAAKTSFESALKANPNHAAAQFGLATACARLGLAEQAREHEEKYAAIRSDRREVARGQRLAYDDDRALGEDIARLYADMGSVYFAAGRTAPAERLWRRAARLHPENRPSRQGLAWLLRMQNKPLESIVMLRELAALEPQSAEYPAEIARLYGGMGRTDDAQRTLDEFAAATPDSGPAQRALAEFYLTVKREPAAAIEHAEKAIRLSGGALDWWLLSAAYELAGDLPAATAALQRACDLDPDNLQYRQLLALLKEQAAAKVEPAGSRGRPDPPRSDADSAATDKAPEDRD